MSRYIKGPDGSRALVGGTGQQEAIAQQKPAAEAIRKSSAKAAPKAPADAEDTKSSSNTSGDSASVNASSDNE